MNAEQVLKICGDIADDMKADATNFDGKPFNGRTVAEYLGNQGAAIAALARIIAADIAERNARELAGPCLLSGEIVRLEPLAPNFGDCVSCDGYILDAAEFPHCPTCARLLREGKTL